MVLNFLKALYLTMVLSELVYRSSEMARLFVKLRAPG